MKTPDEPGQPANTSGLATKILVTLLSIPLMRMELLPQLLPKWMSDYSYGLMFRLGLVFGVVLLVWHVHAVRELWKARNGAFLLASIASALAATWVGKLVRGDFELLAITISGAVCLAMAQKFILGCSWKQVVAAMVLAPGMFYLVTFVVDKTVPEGASVKHFLGDYMPYYWQLGYLLGMFGTAGLMTARDRQ